MTKSAFDFAHRFARKGLDTPRNTKAGNMKLQKLLYFSNLVHIAEFGKPLFKEPIYAYENGCIVESVMNKYYRHHDEFIADSYNSEDFLTEEESFTINVVESVFGDLTAKELSDLNHEHSCWKLAYERSYINESYRNKHLSEISNEEVLKFDIDGIKEIVNGYKSSNEDTAEAKIVVGGTEFYYDPQDIVIDDSLLSILDEFVGEDVAFTIYRDKSQGVIVY